MFRKKLLTALSLVLVLCTLVSIGALGLLLPRLSAPSAAVIRRLTLRATLWQPFSSRMPSGLSVSSSISAPRRLTAQTATPIFVYPASAQRIT